MPIDYKAKENDDVLQLAGQHGLPFEKIWDHPKNKSLKDTRSPNQLLKGDILHIPDKEIESESGATETTNTFVVKIAKTKLKLKIVGKPEEENTDEDEEKASDYWEYSTSIPSYTEPEPKANTPYALYLDGSLFKESETDGDGFMECLIPSKTKNGRICLNPGTEIESELSLSIGGLDPIETPSGIAKRLSNLGFACNEQTDDFDDSLSLAISTFQKANGIDSTGEADDETKSLLSDLHGC